MSNPLERREFYRHPLHLVLRMTNAVNTVTVNVQAKDISLGGVSFLTPVELAPDTLAVLQIAIKGHIYHLRTRVIYSRPDEHPDLYQNGVIFSNCPSQFRHCLIHLFHEVYEYHQSLCRTVDPDMAEETALDRWLKENGSLAAA